MIEFICAKQWYGKVPEPVPAKKHLPDWYKALAPRDEHGGEPMRTIKKCMPFFDALTTGWIIPLAASVALRFSEQGGRIEYGHAPEVEGEFHFGNPVEFHHKKQIGGHPAKKQPAKFMNPWAIKTPPGISCLFMPPVFQDHNMFSVIPAIVDTDTYMSPVNFPFIPISDGEFILPAGMPLIQVIPFRRLDASMEGVVRVATQHEWIADAVTVHKTVDMAGEPKREGYYQKNVRGKRK